MIDAVRVRVLRKPVWHSNLMAGDITVLSPAVAARYVAARVADYVDARPIPDPPPESTQLVDPAVPVLGLPPAVKASNDERWHKQKGRR